MKRRLLLLFCMTVTALLVLASCTSVPQKTAMTDPFENIKISFSGTPDKGYMTADLSECSDIVRQNFRFHCHHDGNLSNGQVTIVTALKITESDIPVKRYQKQYIVTGVEFYPEKLKDYEKDAVNKAVRKYADKYIKDHIKEFPMQYDSRLDRTGWSKSGDFNYTYTYRDIKMLYSVHRKNRADNTYFILYELENELFCTRDMEDSYPAPLKKGESDTGRTYVLVGAKSVTANSNQMFTKNISAVECHVFTTQTKAEQFCIYGGEYDTLTENFV